MPCFAVDFAFTSRNMACSDVLRASSQEHLKISLPPIKHWGLLRQPRLTLTC